MMIFVEKKEENRFLNCINYFLREHVHKNSVSFFLLKMRTSKVLYERILFVEKFLRRKKKCFQIMDSV